MEYLDIIFTPRDLECNLDIVFVHGLNPKGDVKHARKTWTHENGTFWPGTLLPELLPTARILLFAYNSSILRNASNVPVAGHAQSLLSDVHNKRLEANETHRPLIFIAHSLGGLLVKQALVEAQLNARKYGCLKASTYGLVFFATPHNGGNKAGIANVASKICSIFTGEPSNSLLATLEKDSLLNEISSAQFQHQMDNFEIWSFYETRKMDVKVKQRKVLRQFTSMYIVDRNAATFGANSLALDRNHSEICKFSGKEDRVWERVGPCLKTMSTNAQKARINCSHAPREASAAIASHYTIPYQNRRFIGRVKKLKELEEKLILDENCQKLAVVGLGGVGKTQVALKFAYTIKMQRPDYSVFWVPAASGESFKQAYMAIADICSVALDPTKEDPKESVQRYLSSSSAGKWLLIVDNCDDEQILYGTPDDPRGAADCLPQSENGITLFTTRHRKMAVSLAGSEVVELQEMDHEEAEDFLRQSLTQKEMLDDQKLTTELLDKLTYLPLAIAQAAAYINTMQISVKSYLSLLQNTEEDAISLLSREFHDDTRYKTSKNAVATTWLISFNHIRQTDPLAADLLSFMSCIENKAIPGSMLPVVEPVERNEHAIGTLRAYAFVTKRAESDIYDMHRLVHLATKVWLKGCGVGNDLNEKVAAHLAEVFPFWDWSNRFIWREYFPHALYFLQNTESLESSGRHDLCLSVGECLKADGRVREAVVWLEECCFGRRKYLAIENPDRLRSQRALADAYHDNGQVKEAVEMLEQVVEIEGVRQEDDSSRLASQHALARAYLANGQVEKAVELLEYIVTIERKSLTGDHPQTLASQHVLAMAHLLNGKVEKAIELLEHIVAIEGNLLREDHPDRLSSQHELATAYEADGQVEKAIELLEHIVAIEENSPREDHPDRLSSQHALATAYEADGQVEKAIELLEHVVTVEKKSLPKGHPSRLTSEKALTEMYEEYYPNWKDRVFSDGS